MLITKTKFITLDYLIKKLVWNKKFVNKLEIKITKKISCIAIIRLISLWPRKQKVKNIQNILIYNTTILENLLKKINLLLRRFSI